MTMQRVILGLGMVAGALVLGGASVRRALNLEKREPSRTRRTYTLERAQVIPAPVERVFAFFEEPANLGRITPTRMGFDIVRLENLPMQRGTKIEYRIRPLGVPQRWETEIVQYERGRQFVDLQTRGPYRYWRHRHTFSDDGGRTLMRDQVEYQMPLGVLGRLAHALIVSRQLRQIFDHRADAIVRQFGSYRDVEI